MNESENDCYADVVGQRSAKIQIELNSSNSWGHLFKSENQHPFQQAHLGKVGSP